MLTSAEWLSENSERQELALQNIPLAMEAYARYRETELSRPPKDVVEAIDEWIFSNGFIPLNDDEQNIADRHNVILKRGIEHGYSLASGDKWISVSERLPEIYTDVLVWVEGKEFISVAVYSNGEWEASDSLGTPYLVNFWQPLPSPPKQHP